MTVRALACACALAACASGAKLANGPNARPVPDAVIHAVCTSDSGGDAATIQVWRERDGALVVLELSPDIGKRGSHAPTTFFDEAGREVLRLASHAVAPGSPEALEAERKRETVTLEGRKAEVIPCKGK